jgi:hypothetical protein
MLDTGEFDTPYRAFDAMALLADQSSAFPGGEVAMLVALRGNFREQ